jgi:hypothetical protein
MRETNTCATCDHCINTSADRYGEQKAIKEASKWTCFMFPREGIVGVVDGAFVLPDPYTQCWKVRQLCPRSCPLYRQRIPGQKAMNLGDQG